MTCLCCGKPWPKTYCGTCRAQIGCSCGNVTHEHRCPNVVIVTTDAVVEAEWVLANVLDAAVDEQRRRAGLPERGPRPEPPTIEPFTVGVAQLVPL